MSARWDTAVWDTDTWAALTVEELISIAPDPSFGVEMGLDDWRFVVEIALPNAPDGVWGVGEWDTAEWTVLAWTDLTPWVRGLEWTRGADEPYGRPRIGEMVVTIDNAADYWSPFNANRFPGFFGPGTLIRVGCRSATATEGDGWLPQFCGLVDSWPVAFAGQAADSWVEIRCYETVRALSEIDENSGATVGSGDNGEERIERLLDSTAEWVYGFESDVEHIDRYPTDNELQSTDLSANRLTECYLTADSTECVFRSSRNGKALLVSPRYFAYNPSASGPDPDIWPLNEISYDTDNDPILYFGATEKVTSGAGYRYVYVPYDADSLVVSNEDAYVQNDVRFTRSGGTQQVAEEVASISRFGRRTYVRNDLICDSDTKVLDVARNYARDRSLTTLRIDHLSVATSDRSDDTYLAMIAADVGCYAAIWPPDDSGANGTRIVYARIRSMTHYVTPRRPGYLTWITEMSFDTRSVSGLDAAQLPTSF